MSWTVLKRLGNAHLGVRASVTRAKGVHNLRVNLFFGPDVIEQAGWSAGQRFDALLGAGPDLGRLRLSRNPEGAVAMVRTTRKAKSLNVVLPRYGGQHEDPYPVEPCTFRWVDGDPAKGIEITLPRWAGRPPPRFEDDPRPVRNRRL